ncbi:hypothetical protein HDE_14396 [Halotydeus destructor]|nr:hypothetical protein HDE_14396 [Halotydeus destructor]
MKVDEVISVIDNLQLIFGYKLFVKHWWEHVLQISLRILNYMIAIYWLVEEWINWRKTDKIMLIVRDLSLFMFPILAAIPIIVNAKNLRFWIQQVVKMLTGRQRKRFRDHSLICLMTYSGIGLTLLAIKVYEIVKVDHETLDRFVRSNWIWKIDNITIYHRVCAFMMTITEDSFHEKQSVTVLVSLYCSLLILWSMANSAFMNFAIKKTIISREDCLSLISVKERLNGLKTQLDEMVAIVPLLILSALFCQSTGLIMKLQGRFTWNDVYRLTAYFVNLILTIAMLVTVIKVQREDEMLNSKLVSDWHLKLHTVKDDRVVLKFTQTFGIELINGSNPKIHLCG